jgi:prevent-host-death family protein
VPIAGVKIDNVGAWIIYIITMDSTVTISQLQAKAPQCVRRAEKDGAVTISRHGRAVAFLISRDRMEAIIESMEILGNPKAMEAIARYEAGKAKMKDVSCLDEDPG